MRTHAALARLLLLSTLLTLVPPAPPRASAQEAEEEPRAGLRFRLSSGEETEPTPEPARRVAAAEPLPDAETRALLARLPPLDAGAGDAQGFRLREGTLPPPRAGRELGAAFAPPAASGPPPASAASGPLEVLRVAPEGEVELAPAVSVTFSQPMVAVSSHAEAERSVPVVLTPQTPGRWRWLSAQTLVFQPETEGGRLPAATSYTVNVPAGTKSALGNALPSARAFTFTTPPPALKRTHPSGEGLRRDPVIFMEFDQRIDAARVLGLLKVEPAGVRLRAATAEEIAADKAVAELVKGAQEGRWLAVRAVGPGGETKDALPPGAAVRVLIPAGTPSAEGPRVTIARQDFSFKTYGALRVVKSGCEPAKPCRPFEDLTLHFSNYLDERAFRPSQVKVTPDIPGLRVTAEGDDIALTGNKRADTTYTVTLDRSLRDVYGQTLAGSNSFAFRVGKESPNLYTDAAGFVVLDPAARRVYTVYSINLRRLKVSLYKVAPEDWPHFRSYQTIRLNRPASDKTREAVRPPGTLLFERVLRVSASSDQLVETNIDLSPALRNGYGQAVIRVEPVREKGEPERVYDYGDGSIEAWLQATDIGLDAFADARTLVAWASSLKDGRPLAGVRVSARPDGAGGETGADGLARLTLEPNAEGSHPYLVARRGDDVAVLPAVTSPYDTGNARWRRADEGEALRWYVFDDRRLYRPGEEVSVKGWIRRVNLTPSGDTELFAAAGRALEYVLKDSGGNELGKGTATLNALAGFDLKLRLPESMGLGNAYLSFKLPGGEKHTHRFGVQEFRRPEFELTAQASEAPHFVGASATVTAAASYYAGGGLPDAQVSWDVTALPSDYTPPGRDDYTFGKFRPWWDRDYDDGDSTRQALPARTDAAGRHTLRIDFDSVSPPRPSTVLVYVTTQDVNRQTVSATARLLVHPSAAYVGLKPSRTFVQKGQPFDVGLIVTDLDGRALPGREVRLRLARLEYFREGGHWTQKETDVREQTVRSGADASPLRLPTTEGGAYRLKARVEDERGRPNETELTLWAAGGKLPPEGEVEKGEVQLIPDRRTYKGGDVAEILVQSPFVPAEGVLTLRRSGLLRTERFTMSEATHTLRVPLGEGWTPNVHAQVDLVGAAPREDGEGRELLQLPPRPAYASGTINLEIPPASRRLSVTAAPRDAVLEPGRETSVAVEVKDAEGRPVAGTDTAVVVVDESVLALTDYKLEDPLSVFYQTREPATSDHHLRESVDLADPSQFGVGMGGGGAGGGGGGAGGGGGGADYSHTIQSLPARISGNTMSMLSQGLMTNVDYVTVTAANEIGGGDPINLRKNFDALAVFAASLPTDAAGRAEVKVRLPDSLTRYRVTAVSVAGGRLAGSGESAITARLSLMARPSAPRFLNFGDRAELPVVLQNQTSREMSVSVAVRASNAELTAGQGRRVTVPANDRVEVRFPVAALRPGTARFQVAASSGDRTDAAEVSLPVYTPATTESFATYGVLEEGAVAQPVSAPAGAIRDFGGLEVTTSSTQLQELTDAFIYLQTYPYECSEQMASRVLSVVALKDVLAAFKARDLPPPERIREAVDADLRRLEALQNEDGGFDFWTRGRPSDPYVSAHVANALARASKAGFGVAPHALSKSRDYLRDIASKIPRHYEANSRRAVQAYALHVRAFMGDADPPAARRLFAEARGAAGLSLESLGWLLSLLSSDAASAGELEAARRHLNNRVTETAGSAHFADSYGDGKLTVLYSDRRADAVVLDALIGDQPRSDLIPKLVRGLLGHRQKGRWENTQENVFVLLALERYFRTYERETPDFVARVWLGGAFAGEQTYKGRSPDRQRLELPMSLLAERTARAPSRLTIGKEGAGRLYFRVGTRYAPTNLKLDAADYGFRVERVYEAVDDARDVRRDADGTWRVRAGARVRVRLRMLAPARRYHVALTDPLPAGLEAMNPELSTTGPLPRGSFEAGVYGYGTGVTTRYRAWLGRWYDHQNLRDERAEAFASLLWEGEHEYTYFARATTPGDFVVLPPKAEEMYEPETFGRGQTDRLVVE